MRGVTIGVGAGRMVMVEVAVVGAVQEQEVVVAPVTSSITTMIRTGIPITATTTTTTTTKTTILSEKTVIDGRHHHHHNLRKIMIDFHIHLLDITVAVVEKLVHRHPTILEILYRE